MPVKVLSASGSGYLSDVASGIIYAADHGARVINLSLGSPYASRTLQAAIDYAYGKGVTVAAAAGNGGNSTVNYPAGCNHVLGVGATDQNDARAGFSTYNSSVDVAAPGVSIASAWYRGQASYVLASGTSMATPHVAGLAALLISQDGTRTPENVESLIESTADDLGGSGRDDYFGYGRINAAAALNPNLASNISYVTALYRSILDREPDSTGLVGWVNALNNGLPRSATAYALLSSSERYRRYMSNLYLTVLGRNSDATGLDAWVWAMTVGLKEEQAETTFYGCDEYYLRRLSPSSNDQYVISLYQRVLKRAYDPSEVEKQGWINALQSGWSREQVAQAFLDSREYHKIFVSNLYTRVLKRPADTAGLNGWADAMDRGIPQRSVTAAFYASQEYFAAQ